MGILKAPSKQARYREKRVETLRAAARVFARLGFHRASLADVADELGMTPAALYYYMKSKDELLQEAMIFATERLGPVLETLRGDTGLSGVQKLRAYFRAYAEFTCDDFGGCLATNSPEDMPSPYRENTLEDRRELTGFARALVREGIEDGSIRPCDDRLLTYMLYSAANSMARWHSPEGPRSPAETMDAMLDMLVQGIGAETP